MSPADYFFCSFRRYFSSSIILYIKSDHDSNHQTLLKVAKKVQ